MQEEWKDIEGYEGLYMVSSEGRVKRLQSKGCKQERILKPINNGYGYLRVTLFKDGKHITHRIHRLVANTFIPNPENKPEVNHIDEDKENNCVDNLEWCTRKYNCNHGTRTERSAKTQSKPVLAISKDKKSYLYFNSAKDAERLRGFNHSSIASCCRDKRKTHKGYTWQYVEGGEYNEITI